MRPLTLHLCCNDEHGNTDRLEQIELFAAPDDMLLRLECTMDARTATPAVRFNEATMRAVMGRSAFPFLTHGRMVGNIYWDTITVKPEIAARIVFWALRLRAGKTAKTGAFKYDATEYADALTDAVDRRWITVDDLARAVRV